MAEEFEDQDLRGAVFWAVDLREARLRDVDLSGARITHSRLIDVDIDAEVDRLVINGVDVSAYVNEHDRWYPLRAMLRPPDVDGVRDAWDALEQTWAPTIERAQRLPEARLHESVDGEWSFVQTLRHLVFAMDKWATEPIGGEGFHPIGLPNTGSIDLDWPGLDREANPSFAEALNVRADRAERFRVLIESLTPADLRRVVDVRENGSTPVLDCLHVVLEEEFHHHRYARRDLEILET